MLTTLLELFGIAALAVFAVCAIAAWWPTSFLFVGALCIYLAWRSA